jgi:hypothetical protein
VVADRTNFKAYVTFLGSKAFYEKALLEARMLNKH